MDTFLKPPDLTQVPVIEQLRHRSCCCKMRLEGLSDAQAEANRMQRRYGNGSDGEPFSAYHCGFCGDWHIGHAGDGGSRTEELLNGVLFEELLRFEFTLSCILCGKNDRFNGNSKRAARVSRAEPGHGIPILDRNPEEGIF